MASSSEDVNDGLNAEAEDGFMEGKENTYSKTAKKWDTIN